MLPSKSCENDRAKRMVSSWGLLHGQRLMGCDKKGLCRVPRQGSMGNILDHAW